MLSFLDSGLDSSREEVSIRRASGASSHRFGLDAELSEWDLSGRVALAGFSKPHCESCEATATWAIFAGIVPRGYSAG